MSTVHLLSLSDWYWYHVVFEGVFLIVHLCAQARNGGSRKLIFTRHSSIVVSLRVLIPTLL